jgi:hypothetical protein
MKHRIPHDLSLELATRATREALEHYREDFKEYDTQGRWIDERHAQLSFRVLGRTLHGAVGVERDHISLELDLPLALRPFRNKALRLIEAEIRVWIERARNGELD